MGSTSYLMYDMMFFLGYFVASMILNFSYVVALTMTMLKGSSAKQDLEPFSWVADKIRNNPFISELDASTLTKSTLVEAMNLNSNQENVRPLLIKNLFPTVQNDEWVTTLKSKLKNEKIEYEAKRLSEDSLEVYECKFQEYMKLIEQDQSDHEDSLYFMSEQILEKVPQLSNSLQLPINLFENNQFNLFPPSLRPNNALIIGGSGAKSFLHIDPYEWIGTNYLVKGKKLCKYCIPPSLHLLTLYFYRDIYL